MAKRPVDKTKKSNEKCEHCEHWNGWPCETCRLTGESKQYYQRCKKFAWRAGL